MSGMKSGIPLQVHNRCLIASVQVELSESLLNRFQAELLERIAEEVDTRGVVLDLSGLRMIDLPDFEQLTDIIAKVNLMGYNTCCFRTQSGGGFCTHHARCQCGQAGGGRCPG